MLVLVRMSSELMIKSDRVRTRFQKRLVKNIKAALSAECKPGKSSDDGSKKKSFSVKSQWARIYIELEDPAGLEVLKRVYGIHSFSVVENQCESNLDEIVKVGFETFKRQLKEGESFGVKSKRAGKTLPFTSIDVNVKLGAALNVGVDRVNLTNPDRLFLVEVRPEATFFYSDSIMGPGGFPLGTAGHAVCLISGGFDSPAAAWMMMKRGITLDFILCNMAGVAFERSVLEIARVLANKWAYGSQPKFYAVDYEAVVENLKKSIDQKYAQVILKRLFYRTAEQIAEMVGGDAIVTGEAVAQVSSQTLQNLRAIDDVAERPVFRPLIAFDKEDIINMCRMVGTHDLSCKVQEFCQIVPVKPSTACKVEKARFEESKVDLTLIDKGVETARRFDLRNLNNSDLVSQYVSIEGIPEGATVVDCRPTDQFDEWHYPDAINVEYFRLVDNFKKMDKSKKYLIYCPVGMQSTLVAEKMQSEGYLSYSFKGGVEPLKNLVSASAVPSVH